jgi:N-acetylglucosaminyldiphosphoundecaprenol N-acetyl-beta-D-mannosaminyltransferase
VSDSGLSVYEFAHERVALSGVGFDRLTEAEVVARVRAALAAGRGGRIVTPNVDILRLCRRGAEARAHLAAATYVVADGMPLVWASRLRGTALPERVAGSSLIWTLSAAVAADRRSVYLLGGEPGAADRAGEALAARCPGLRVAGTGCPPPGFDTDPARLAAVCDQVVAARPDVVYVGLGFPRQERLIGRLAPALPDTWFVGCGAAIGFAAGTRRRAPRWMQRAGLEWLHRLGTEPTRLFRRYLVHDAPFALLLLAVSAVHRRRG